MALVIGSAGNPGGPAGPGHRVGPPTGVSYPPKSARYGPANMPRTIKCTNCGVALNLPEQAQGRRLKCPKCGTKFLAEDAQPQPISPPPVRPDPSASSTVTLDRSTSSGELPLLPTAPGNLRETFDLPLVTDAAAST